MYGVLSSVGVSSTRCSALTATMKRMAPSAAEGAKDSLARRPRCASPMSKGDFDGANAHDSTHTSMNGNAGEFYRSDKNSASVAETDMDTNAVSDDGNVSDEHVANAWKHWRSLGSPRWICAPMVDGSELAFRDLVRRYGVGLAYTPMLNSKIFAANEVFRRDQFTTDKHDRPLVAQFCADDPKLFVDAARHIQDQVDAVDLNLGCPQGIARKGHYGAYLQDEWDLIESIVRAGSQQLSVPMWCKIRIFEDRDRSVAYAKMIERAGCSVLAVHGRTREQKGKFCPPADMETIRAIRKALRIPVIANGNVLCLEDAKLAQEQSGTDAVMSAFALLDNPATFMEVDTSTTEQDIHVEGRGPSHELGQAERINLERRKNGQMPSRLELAREYLDIAERRKTQMRMVRLHMFKLFRSRLDVNMDLNSRVAACRSIEDFRAIARVIEARCDADGESFEARVAAGRTPAHVLCEKTLKRIAKAEARRREAAAADPTSTDLADGSSRDNAAQNGAGPGGSNASDSDTGMKISMRVPAGSGAWSARDALTAASLQAQRSSARATSSGISASEPTPSGR